MCLDAADKQQLCTAIVRPLKHKSRVMLADQPIASLDPHNEKRTVHALRHVDQEDAIT